MIAKCFLVGLGIFAAASALSADSRVLSSVVRTDTRTGRLVRKTIVSGPGNTSSAAPARANHDGPAAPQKLTDLIDAIALKNQVEAPLVHSVIETESNYNPLAVSGKGAQGLMQLIPATARRFGVKDSFDMQDNVEGGTKYLKYLIDLFHGDYARAVAAYNAGEAAVTRYGGVPPYKETQNYVTQVARRLESRRKAWAANSSASVSADVPVNASAAAPVETYNPVIASVNPDGRIYYRTP